jgi:hypothetical protein
VLHVRLLLQISVGSNSISTRYMRGHFNKPGASAHESLNNLAAGFERSEAARLFYETCGRIPHLVLNFSSMGSMMGVCHCSLIFSLCELPFSSLSNLTSPFILSLLKILPIIFGQVMLIVHPNFHRHTAHNQPLGLPSHKLNVVTVVGVTLQFWLPTTFL